MLHNVAESRTPIILTNRTSHVKLLAEMLEPHIANVIQLTGEGSTRNKREAFQRLYDIPQDAPLVIVATGKYIGEGFDYPRLDTPISCSSFIMERLDCPYAGRLHREREGKTVCVSRLC